MHATISYFFSLIVNMNKVETCMHNNVGVEQKSYRSFRLWVSSALGPHFHWKIFSKKAPLHDPDRYRDPQLTVECAGKEDHECSTIDAGLRLRTKSFFCAQSETSIRISRGAGLFRVISLSPPFIPTRLTAPGSPRMVWRRETTVGYYVSLFSTSKHLKSPGFWYKTDTTFKLRLQDIQTRTSKIRKLSLLLFAG